MGGLAAAASGVLRRHAGRLDAALGVVVAGLGVLSLWSTPDLRAIDHPDPGPLGLGLTLLAGAAVAVRSRWPVAALVVSCVAAFAPLQLGYPQSVATLAPLLVLYTVSVARPGSVSAPAAVLVHLSVGLLLVSGPVQPTLDDWVSNTFMIVAVWAVGRSVRSRRAESAGLEERNRALYEAREAGARATEAAERAAIAREMHDLVTHGITELTVQAAAARRLLRHDPDTAEHLLADVERTGRDAITGMRRVLGVLQPADVPAELRPQPGLADLDSLLDAARADGMEVELVCAGAPAEVERGVALTAYRIVQEALRNTRRHAGRARARVSLDWRPGNLALAVEDDGRGASAALGSHPPDGSGLQALDQRVQAYGGRLRAGPRSGGGFAVTAILPTTPRSHP